MYKFDNSAELVIENTLNNIDEDGAAGESEHHKFWSRFRIIQFFCFHAKFFIENNFFLSNFAAVLLRF